MRLPGAALQIWWSERRQNNVRAICRQEPWPSGYTKIGGQALRFQLEDPGERSNRNHRGLLGSWSNYVSASGVHSSVEDGELWGYYARGGLWPEEILCKGKGRRNMVPGYTACYDIALRHWTRKSREYHGYRLQKLLYKYKWMGKGNLNRLEGAHMSLWSILTSMRQSPGWQARTHLNGPGCMILKLAIVFNDANNFGTHVRF